MRRLNANTYVSLIPNQLVPTSFVGFQISYGSVATETLLPAGPVILLDTTIHHRWSWIWNYISNRGKIELHVLSHYTTKSFKNFKWTHLIWHINMNQHWVKTSGGNLYVWIFASPINFRRSRKIYIQLPLSKKAILNFKFDPR